MLNESVVFFAFVLIVNSQILIQETKYESLAIIDENEATVKVVVDIISSFYYGTTSTLNIFTSTSSDDSRFNTEDIVAGVVNKLGTNITILLEDSEGLMKTARKKTYNILFVDSYKTFRKIFIQMNPKDFNYQGWYLIIVTQYSDNQHSRMKKMFDDLWRNYIINVNIILKVDQNPHECKMFTFFPFSEFYCEKVYPVLINTFVTGTGFIKSVDHFPNKMSNLHECPITVATFDIPPFMVLTEKQGVTRLEGFDGVMIRAIAKQMNFTLNANILNETLWGTVEEDGSSTGAISMVMNRHVNFTAGYFTSSPLRNMFMVASYVYYTSNLIWVIGPGQPLDSFERFLKPFEPAIWFCLIVVFFISIVAITVIKCQSRKVRNFVFGNRIQNPIMNMINVFLGGAMTILPRKNFARTFLGLFMIYSFVIRNAYTGALFNFLQLDLRTQQVKNMREMLEKSYNFFVLDAVNEFIEPFKTVSKKMMSLNKEQFDSFRVYLLDPNSKVALLASEDHVAYWNKEGFPRIFFNTCQEKQTTINLCLYMHKTSCLANEFNENILNFNANGLLQIWKKNYRDMSFLKKKTAIEGPQKLTWENLTGGFYFYVFGLAASAVCFIIELIVQQVRNVHGF